MDTIRQIAFENGGIPVGSFNDHMENIAKSSTNPYVLKLAETYQTYYDFDEAFKQATKGALIMAEDRLFLEYSIRDRYTDQ